MTVIVFDLGGVLSDDEGKIEALAAEWGVDPVALAGPYWTRRPPYDRGVSNLEYFSEVASDLQVPMDEALAEHLGHTDARNWAAIRPTAEAILADLHAAGQPTAILSNAPLTMADVIEVSAWRPLVGEVVVSAREGVIKPEAEIYRIVEQRLGRAPGDLVFIDDRPDNVEAAQRAGWQAHLWVDDDTTRATLVAGGHLR